MGRHLDLDCAAADCRRRVAGWCAVTEPGVRVVVYGVCGRHVDLVNVFLDCKAHGCNCEALDTMVPRSARERLLDVLVECLDEGLGVAFPEPHDWRSLLVIRAVA
jgi:hypothetical protein